MPEARRCATCGADAPNDALACPICDAPLSASEPAGANLPTTVAGTDGWSEKAAWVSPVHARLNPALSGRYHVERELGAGGMATVFLARDLKHDRDVALKVMNERLAPAIGTERFLREIRTTAQLRHPHIVPLFDSGVADGIPYYVMPRVEGESLAERLRREVCLAPDVALSIAGEVAGALAYAHEQGVVHRDIKPGNVLLEGGHAVVSDFGIAAAVMASDEEGLTQTGMFVGTPAFMAPEQAYEPEAVDGRTDVYSLGCVLYAMLVGEPPFAGATPMAVLALHSKEPPRSLDDVRPDLDPSIGTVLERALAKAPEDRFESAEAMRRAIQAVATGSGSIATADPATETVSPARRSARPELAARLLTWRNAVVGGVLVLAAWGGLNAAGLLPSGRGPGSFAELDGPPMLAVLPLDDLSDDPEAASFASGVHDDILNQLAKIRSIRVISRTSVLQYAEDRPDVPTIARALGADVVLEGSVRRAGERVRVVTQLTDPATDEHVWSETYDRTYSLESLFDIQTSIATDIAAALRTELSPEEESDLAARPTESDEAWRHYQRARAALSGSERAEALREAVAADSAFVDAWGALAITLGFRHFDDVFSYRDEIDRAMARLRALDPLAPAARLAEGYYLYYIEEDYEAALRLLGQEAAARPSDVGLLRALGSVSSRLGRWDEAADYFRRVLALDQTHQGAIRDLVYAALYRRRWDEAEEWNDRLANPNWSGSALVPLLRGDTAASVRAFRNRVLNGGFVEGWTQFLWPPTYDVVVDLWVSDSLAPVNVIDSTSNDLIVAWRRGEVQAASELGARLVSMIEPIARVASGAGRDNAMLLLAAGHLFSGDADRALRVMDDLGAPGALDAINAINVREATILIGLVSGDHDRAALALEDLLTMESYWTADFAEFLFGHPEWAEFAAHPEYRRVIEEARARGR